MSKNLARNDSLTIVVGHTKAGVPADGFVKIMQRTLRMLKGLDKQIDPKATKREWVVSKVSMDSPLHLSISAPYRIAPIKTSDALASDFDRLEKGKDPRYLSPAQRSDARAIIATLRQDVQWFEYQSDKITIRPTEQVARSVETFKPMSTTYKEVGSVEGNLEIASVHGADHIKVWDRRFDAPVDCMVNSRQFNEALDYLKKRSCVSVRGIIHFSNRRPDRVEEVFDIREMPGISERISVSTIRPIDLTGGIEPADYLRGDGDEE